MALDSDIWRTHILCFKQNKLSHLPGWPVGFHPIYLSSSCIPDERTTHGIGFQSVGGTSPCFCLESCNTSPSVRREASVDSLNAREAFQQLAILFPFWRSLPAPQAFSNQGCHSQPVCGSCLRPSYFCMFFSLCLFSARNWLQWRSDRVYRTSAILSTWLPKSS